MMPASRASDTHPIRRMTPKQRVEWFGRSPQCNEQQHESCTSWTGHVIRLGYDKLRVPCGCGCHFEAVSDGP